MFALRCLQSDAYTSSKVQAYRQVPTTAGNMQVQPR